MPTVHVFGAAGFAGAQLTAYLDAHPTFDLGVITARGDAARRLVDVAPQYRVERVLGRDVHQPPPRVAAGGDDAQVEGGVRVEVGGELGAREARGAEDVDGRHA